MSFRDDAHLFSQVMSPSADPSATAWMAAAGAKDAAPMKDCMKALKLRALDTGRPASYINWRLALKAAVARRSDDARLERYLELIEDSRVGASELSEGVATIPGLRLVDRMLYAALLECIEGDRRDDVLDEIRTTTPFGSGRLALRCLDKKYQQSGARAKVAATAELLSLAPAGKSAGAVDAFLSKFRVLAASAGDENAGPAVQVEVLQRAAIGHPILSSVLMAWRQAGAHDPAVLRARMEDVVAEGLAGPAPGRSVAGAWAAMEAGLVAEATYSPPGLAAGASGWQAAAAQQAASAATCWESWAAIAAAAQAGPTCYNCGQRGHIQRLCPSAPKASPGRAQDVDKLDAILSTLTELTTELRASRAAQSGTRAPGRAANADGKPKK